MSRRKKSKKRAVGLLLLTGSNRAVKNIKNADGSGEKQYAKAGTMKSINSLSSMPMTPVQRRRDRSETQSIARTGSNTDFGDLEKGGLRR